MANKIKLIIEADDQATTKFKRMVAGLERGIDSVDKETKKLDRSATSLGNTLKWAGGIFATYLGARVISSFSSSIFDAGIQVDRFEAGLKGALGTYEAANESIKWLREEADRLGLVFENQVGAFQKLAAAARGTTLEGQATRDIFMAVSEAATAMQLSTEETEGALYAVSQMISKGRVAAEELRGQLGERLPGAFQIAARAMGVTTEELSKMLEMGEVVADEFLPAFAKQLHQELGEAALEAADTTERNINRMKNAWFDMKSDVADDLMPALNESIMGLLEAIKRLQEDGTLKIWADAIGKTMATAIEWAETAIRFWGEFFAIGAEAELKKVQTELDNLNQQLRQGGVEFLAVGEAMVEIGNNTEELEQKIAALKERERELIDIIQEKRLALVESADTHTEVTDIEIENIERKSEAEVEALEKIREAQEEYGEKFEERWVAREKMWLKGTEQWRKNEEKRRKEEEKRETQLQHFKMQTAQNWLQFAQSIGQTLLTLSQEQSGALFYITRGLQFAQAVVSAFAAHNLALANPPGPPATIPLANAVLALGLGQAAAIAATTFTGHQEGGWIRGGSGTKDDIYIGTIGQTAHLAQGGEYIVRKDRARENAGLLEDINAGRLSYAPMTESEITLHNYITVELEGETLGQFVDTRVYEQSKAGARIVHHRGIKT